MVQPPLVPPSSWLLGNATSLKGDPVPFLNECTSKYGPVFRIRILAREFTVVSLDDPALHSAIFRNSALSLDQGGINTLRFDAFLNYGNLVHTKGVNASVLRSTKLDSKPLWQINDKSLRELVNSLPNYTSEGGAVVTDPESLMLHLVASSYAKVQLGEPLASNPKLKSIFCAFFLQVELCAVLVTLLPPWLVPFVFWFLFPLRRAVTDMEAILKPEIKRRRQHEKQADQFDFLDLLMEQETNDEYLTTNILLLQIAAMRNTSLMLQNILYDIAENPSIANALRREMKEHIDFSLNEPLTRQTLTNLTLLDSFIRESLFQSAKPITSVRTATSDTAINGFDIPAGTDILLYGAKVHGKAFWETPMEEFYPDRWIGSGKHATTTSSEYMLFGGGKTICPGRFLAVLEMKTFVCCLLNRYDVRLHHGGKVKREFSMKHVLPAMEKGKQVPLVFVPRK